MPKRFTATEKWERPWFRSLPLHYKTLWLYMLDKCDMAGVWYVDLEMASFLIGNKYELTETLTVFCKQVVKLGDGKRWWITDFPRFQYGGLKASVRVQASVIAIMQNYKEMEEELKSLLSVTKDLPKTYLSPKDKDKDKDKDVVNILNTKLTINNSCVFCKGEDALSDQGGVLICSGCLVTEGFNK